MPNSLTIGEVLGSETVRPLMRANKKNGETYQRLPGVEQQIAAILRLTTTEFNARLAIENRTDDDFVAEEALIHLLRTAVRANKLDFSEELATVLFRRAAQAVRGRVGRVFVNATIIADCTADVLSTLFAELYAVETTRADFAEVRFWLFLRRVVNRSVSRHLKQQFAADKFEFLDDQSDDDGAPYELEASNEFSSFDRYDTKKALSLLPEPIRTAFVLRHKMGLQIYSADESEMTIAGYFNKTERTIRNWLRRADGILGNLREGKL